MQFYFRTQPMRRQKKAHKKILKRTTLPKKSIPPQISLSSRWAMKEEEKIARGETRTS